MQVVIFAESVSGVQNVTEHTGCFMLCLNNIFGRLGSVRRGKVSRGKVRRGLLRQARQGEFGSGRLR